MKTKLLGRTELEVPVLGLGTAFLGREYAAINFEPNESKTAYFWGCNKSVNPPFFDGIYSKLVNRMKIVSDKNGIRNS